VQPSAAEAACRKAIKLKPDFAQAHTNLSLALLAQGKYRAAEAACRKAIDLQPDLAEAYDNLGIALASQGQHGAAEAAYRKAIDLQPDFVPTYFNLAQALSDQARFEEALAFIKKGNALLPARSPLREEMRPLLQRCQRYMTLDARLPRILKGTAKPASAAEQIEFAQLCRLKKLYAAAARFYAAAFAAESKLAQDVPKGARARQGEAAPAIDAQRVAGETLLQARRLGHHAKNTGQRDREAAPGRHAVDRGGHRPGHPRGLDQGGVDDGGQLVKRRRAAGVGEGATPTHPEQAGAATRRTPTIEAKASSRTSPNPGQRAGSLPRACRARRARRDDRTGPLRRRCCRSAARRHPGVAAAAARSSRR
jgi:tetratricopeptide (TPR) repeat protein